MDLIRQVTGGFKIDTLTRSEDPKLRALGTQIEKAFNDPIKSIKAEYGLDDAKFFTKDEEQTLAGPFSQVSVFFTDAKAKKWVKTEICGLASLILLKDVGKPITVLRVYQEDAESGMVGDLVFEYEVPLNVKVEKLSSNLTALSFTDRGEYVGFYFNQVDECSLLSTKLEELTETLLNDGTGSNALHEVARIREMDRERRQKKLCESIDIEVLQRGTGTQEHERELYKFLAAAGLETDDLKKEATVQVIQELLAELLVDQELEDGEDQFLAQAMMSKAQAGVHGKTSDRRPNAVKRNSRVPMSIQKKVTFAEPSNAKSMPERIGLDSDRSLENIADESDDLKNNSLFDDRNLMFRMGAVSQIQTKGDKKNTEV